MMKIGVIVEMLRQPLRDGIRTAAEIGCQGIQTYGINEEFNLLDRTPAEARELAKYIRDNGLELVSVAGDMPGHGYTRAAEAPDRIAKVKTIIDMALEMDCRIITNHIGVVPANPEDPEYAVLLDALGQVTSYAASRGSAIAIETGPERSTVLQRLLKDVNSPALGINLDPANLAMVQNEDAVEAVNNLSGSIIHTHAKDGIHLQDCDAKMVYDAFAEGGFEALLEKTGKLFEEVPLGAGQVRWDAYLAALKASGYDGFLTIEREVGGDPRADIAMAVNFLKEKLAVLG